MADLLCRRCGSPVPRGQERCPKCGAPAPVDVTAASSGRKTRFNVGDVIDNRYTVVNVLPTGGMGELYKVRHLHLGDFRVIKVRKPTIREDETGRKRFLREAQLAASIKHPNLAAMYDFSSLEDGSYYMVTEYVDGLTIADHIQAGGRFETAQVLRIAQQALRALEALHGAGIIHRDVASDNLMLAQDLSGETIVKVIDLGIAKPLGGEGLTSTGFFVGKARYASPEQINTEDPSPIDPRSDLYSLGVVLYEMISGDVPFAASTPAASVIKRLSSEVTEVPRRDASVHIEPDVEAFILKLLRREREERYSSASAALREVDRLIAARPNYDREGTLSRITRDRELYGLAGLPSPPAETPAPDAGKMSGTVEFSLDELAADKDYIEAQRAKAQPPQEPPPIRSGTLELSLDEINAREQAKAAKQAPPAPPAVEETEAIPQISKELRDQLMGGGARPAAPAPPPPPPAPVQPPMTPPTQVDQPLHRQAAADERKPSLSGMPTFFQGSEGSLGDGASPTVPLPKIQAGAVPPPPPAPPPVQPKAAAPTPPPPAPATAQRAPAPAPPPPPRAQQGGTPSTIMMPAPSKGMSRKTLVVILILVAFAIIAFLVAAYAGFRIWQKFSAQQATETAAPTETTATAAATDTATTETAAATDTTQTAATSTEAPATVTETAATDTTATAPPMPDTALTATTATTATVAPPKKPATKPVPKKPKPKEPVPETQTTAPPPPPPPPPPEVKEGDLVDLGEGVQDARVISKQPLRLPVGARLRGTKGTATIGMIVGVTGVPEEVHVINSSGDETIDKAALEAARNSRFIPASKDGVRVRVRKVLDYGNQ